MDDEPFGLRCAKGYRPLPEEWCQLASDLRMAVASSGDVIRVAIIFEFEDGSKMSFEHDERLRPTE